MKLKGWFITIVVSLILPSVSVLAQNKEGNFLFYLKGEYSPEVKEIIRNHDNFKSYKYFGNYYIGRERNDVINYNYVNEGLNRLFPNSKKEEFLCLDIENKYYQDIKKYPKGHPDFKEGLKQLVRLVTYIKYKRPNVKIGIYGLPFTFYYNKQRIQNEGQKFDELFKIVDYISPSLYLSYPDFQRGKQKNLDYLKDNLDVALEYGKKFNKPVIPYVWYLIHPSNKLFGWYLIDRDEMQTYVQLIKEHTFEGKRASGVIWWEPSKLKYKLSFGQRGHLKANMDKNEMFLNYFPYLLN